MARPGRALEQLVRLLEGFLANKPVVIRSPDYIDGRNSHTRREVDVSLRSNIGSAQIFAIIECRDRQDAQDVTWIEQLASKRDDVGADKAVAVSTVGFTRGARGMADANRIELRTLEDVTDTVVFDWLQIETVDVRVPYVTMEAVGFDMLDPSIELSSETEDAFLHGRIQRDAKVFIRKSDNVAVSIDDIWASAPEIEPALNDAFRGTPPGQIRTGMLRAVFSDPNRRYAVRTREGRLMDIEVIEITGDFHYEEANAPIIRRFAYCDDSGSIVEGAEARLVLGDIEFAFGLHATPGGQRVMLTAGQENPSGRTIYIDMTTLIEVSDAKAEGNT